MKEIVYKPIGWIHTPFKSIEGMPVQPGGGKGVQGEIELNATLMEGLKDLEGFSHIILLYHLHLVKRHQLTVVPFLDNKPHGIFATRAPARPNSIGISIVKLLRVEANILTIENVDIMDMTPLLDIKPFFPKYDNHSDVKTGWLETVGDVDITKVRSDKRFE